METSTHDYGGFTTTELPLAAFFLARGHNPTLIPPTDPSQHFSFAFHGNPQQLTKLAEEFAAGGTIPAFRYYQAITSLKGQIRLAKGGWR